MGKLFKWLLILFNILMVFWLVSGVLSVGEVIETAKSDAEQACAAIGATPGMVMLLSFWIVGDNILGISVLFTRPKG